jgi:hypothetical protein
VSLSSVHPDSIGSHCHLLLLLPCRTVRTWDVYDNKSQLEVLQHSHDVLALAWRPDGKQLASSTLDGQIYFWNAQVRHWWLVSLLCLLWYARQCLACDVSRQACRLRTVATVCVLHAHLLCGGAQGQLAITFLACCLLLLLLLLPAGCRD